MNIGVYQNAAALTSIEDWQAITSRNVASSVTKGYKAQRAAFEHKVQQAADGSALGNQDLRQNIFPAMSHRSSMVMGMMEPTSNPLDFAIKGEGFFEVQNPAGRSFYTRDGQFKINAEGVLVDKNGFEVQGTTGAINIDQALGAFSVGANGEINQDGNVIGQLRILQPMNQDNLKMADGGFVETEPGAGAIEELENAQVLQGFVENSNVSPIREMVNMIQASRAYEANAKVITAYDQHLDKAIQQLAPPNR